MVKIKNELYGLFLTKRLGRISVERSKSFFILSFRQLTTVTVSGHEMTFIFFVKLQKYAKKHDLIIKNFRLKRFDSRTIIFLPAG